ncbi:potassium channel family protein [Neobacillus terrae]|uniref:potassium channel family protein n=1 Tax=Neobacillus terrae TaxID=3034837 RepID=UPI00140964AF|nr:potassium channel protein [Neobacillus terrae]NHM32569.1 potassium channel protein [Neobacillus terrae]
MPNHIYIKFLRLPLLARILLITLLFVVLFGILIHLLEPKTFPNILDGIWWAIITASTVGYGDYVPHSIAGRAAAIILILIGAGFVSSYFVTLSAVAVTRQNAFSEGKITYKESGHIIIIGWNERSRELIQKISNQDYPQPLVLIDETLKSIPIHSRYVHYIQGKPHLDETLKKANLLEADRVLITADQGNEEIQADMYSILTLLAIKGLSPQIPCIVEILTSEQVINANRAGADLVLQSNKLTSVYMLNSLRSANAGLIPEVFGQLQENRLLEISPESEHLNKSFIETSNALSNDKKILIGIKREKGILLNPPPDFVIKESDLLLAIK